MKYSCITPLAFLEVVVKLIIRNICFSLCLLMLIFTPIFKGNNILPLVTPFIIYAGAICGIVSAILTVEGDL